MPEEVAVQTFTPEEEARYARWGLGSSPDGEPTAVTTTPTEEAPPAEPETEPTQDEVEDETGENTEQPKKKSGVQRLKEKLQAEKEARIRAEERAKVLEDLQTKPGEAKATPKAEQLVGKTPKPDINTWEGTHDEYLEARDRWLLSVFEETQEKKAAESKAKTEQQTKTNTWNERLEAAKAVHPDLEEVLETEFPLSPAMQEALLESEKGPEIGYYLVKHQEEAKRIAALGPLAAAREIGKIEAQLASAPPKAAARTSTSAPPPPTPVGGRPIPTVDPNKLSDEEWLQHYRKQRAGR